MNSAEQRHFQRLPPEAQHEALWRLALSGLPADELARQTGWDIERIRRTVGREPATAMAPWKMARRAAGSAAGSLRA